MNSMHQIGTGNAMGYFLASEHYNVASKTISAQHAQAVTADGMKYVPAGAVYPANDSTAQGFVLDNINVTEGDAPGAVVTSGRIFTNRLPEALDADARTALAERFTFDDNNAITRPY